MKTLISFALLFSMLATALAPPPSQPFEKLVFTKITEPDCKRYEGKKCPLHKSPVCGTDERTYYNECALCVFIRTSTKKKDKLIKIGKWEACRKTIPYIK
uniref:Proteinase inhibitor PSKP-1 n=1 Tax=Pithecopus nordestinus TaxID=2034992 RepID=K9N0E2_PITNO|nr:proteinase inhibitor PSKP-1 [Pithecopus nordestinus]